MKILILGATGTFGRFLVNELLEKSSHRITAFSRHADEYYKEDARIHVVNGDATDKDQLAEAIAGQDVVYCAISGAELPVVAKNLVAVMGGEKTNRLVFMGAVGIYNEIPDDIDGEDNVDNEPAQIPNRDAVTTIENSTLNYSILRPGYLRMGSSDDFVLTRKGEPAKGYVTTMSSLANLAIEMMEDEKKYAHESISITKDMTKMTRNR